GQFHIQIHFTDFELITAFGKDSNFPWLQQFRRASITRHPYTAFGQGCSDIAAIVGAYIELSAQYLHNLSITHNFEWAACGFLDLKEGFSFQFDNTFVCRKMGRVFQRAFGIKMYLTAIRKYQLVMASPRNGNGMLFNRCFVVLGGRGITDFAVG